MWLYYDDAEVAYCYGMLVKLLLVIAWQFIVLQKYLAIAKGKIGEKGKSLNRQHAGTKGMCLENRAMSSCPFSQTLFSFCI